MILTLYTRADCHLCTAAEQIVVPMARRLGVGFRRVDVDADPAALAPYDHAVPVVALEGKEICRHRVEPELVEAAIREKQAAAR